MSEYWINNSCEVILQSSIWSNFSTYHRLWIKFQWTIDFEWILNQSSILSGFSTNHPLWMVFRPIVIDSEWLFRPIIGSEINISMNKRFWAVCSYHRFWDKYWQVKIDFFLIFRQSIDFVWFIDLSSVWFFLTDFK